MHRPVYGHLAQLEEHPLDVRKVGGSNPSMSTNKDRLTEAVFLFDWPCRCVKIRQIVLVLFV